MTSPHPLHIFGHGCVSLVLLLLGLGGPKVQAAETNVEKTRNIDVGVYSINLALDRSWSVEASKVDGYVLLTYTTQASAQGESAKIGVFHFVVPPAVREADRTEIGGAYAVKDAMGVRKALFGSVVKLQRALPQPRELRRGTVYEYKEPIELVDGISRSSRFVRARVYFPASFSKGGDLFLVIGFQQFTHPQPRPDALEKMNDVVDGLIMEGSTK